jgi:putative restriction endonuclease
MVTTKSKVSSRDTMGDAMSSMRYLPGEAFIANTDRAWFDFLSGRSRDVRLDEVNFWQPMATKPMRAMRVGEPIFFRLKKPDYAIAGYGFFAHFQVLDLNVAWQAFGEKNGNPDRAGFLTRIGRFRRVDLLRPGVRPAPIGCTVLRDAVFWPASRWIPWGVAQGWQANIVQGKTERDPDRVALLMAAMREDHAQPPPDLVAPKFELAQLDQRQWAMRGQIAREGQGTFRLRLLKAYGQCAITGEHTPVVLDAAHIQPYFGPQSNHPQNGLILTKVFHALFDAGYVTITPDMKVRISDRLRTEWHNGHRYYPFHDRPLVSLPSDENLRPSREALAWHQEHRFDAA